MRSQRYIYLDEPQQSLVKLIMVALILTPAVAIAFFVYGTAAIDMARFQALPTAPGTILEKPRATEMGVVAPIDTNDDGRHDGWIETEGVPGAAVEVSLRDGVPQKAPVATNYLLAGLGIAALAGIPLVSGMLYAQPLIRSWVARRAAREEALAN